MHSILCMPGSQIQLSVFKVYVVLYVQEIGCSDSNHSAGFMPVLVSHTPPLAMQLCNGDVELSMPLEID